MLLSLLTPRRRKQSKLDDAGEFDSDAMRRCEEGEGNIRELGCCIDILRINCYLFWSRYMNLVNSGVDNGCSTSDCYFGSEIALSGSTYTESASPFEVVGLLQHSPIEEDMFDPASMATIPQQQVQLLDYRFYSDVDNGCPNIRSAKLKQCKLDVRREQWLSQDMKIKKLMPMDSESRGLIDWMEKGVYDALQKNYLRTLMFCVCEAIEGPMIEEYACKIRKKPDHLVRIHNSSSITDRLNKHSCNTVLG